MSFLLDEMGLDKMGLDEMGWHRFGCDGVADPSLVGEKHVYIANTDLCPHKLRTVRA